MRAGVTTPYDGARDTTFGATLGAAGDAAGPCSGVPRHSAHARGIAPLWNADDVAALLSRRHPAIAGDRLELISIRRGALRIGNDRLDATYEVIVGERAGGDAAQCVPATPERRFALVRVPLGAAAPSLADATIFLSPDDPKLGGALLLDDAVMSEVVGSSVRLTHSEIVAHRFGSRMAWRATVVDAADAREIFVKARRARPAATLTLAAAPLGAAASTPRRVGGARAGAATIDGFEWVHATPLHERLMARGAAGRAAGMSDAAMLRTAGAAVADLHVRARLDAPRGAAAAPRRDMTSEFAQLRAMAQSASRFFDGVESPIAAALARLGAPSEPLANAALHGDLHDKQILLRPGGAVFIDLDNAALGESELDLGNLAAHVALRSLQSGRPVGESREAEALVVEGYVAAGGAPRPHRVSRYREATLVRLALLYLMRLNSTHLFAALLDEAERSHEER